MNTAVLTKAGRQAWDVGALGVKRGTEELLALLKKWFAKESAPSEDLRPVSDGRYRKKIMVVDDDPVVLKALSMALNSRGYRVVTALDGPHAIGLMRDEGPDMMLMDVSFPVESHSESDGFRIAQWIRYMNRGLPTIMMSGSYKPEYETRTVAMGAETFMIKPLDTRLLVEAITKALGTEITMPTLKFVS